MNTTLPPNVCPIHLAHTHNGQCRLANPLGSPSGFEHLGGEAVAKKDAS